MKTEKICIYTCITGDYDNLHDVEKDEDIDYICFTNNHTLKSDRWQFVYIQDEENIGDMLLSRKIKILGHPLLEKYDISIWVDGALQVKKDIRKLLTTFGLYKKRAVSGGLWISGMYGFDTKRKSTRCKRYDASLV